MKRPAQTGWTTALAYPLPVKGGGILTTLSEARAFIMKDVPAGHHEYKSWRHAGALIIHAAKIGTDIDAATLAMENAMFMDYRLDLTRFYAEA